MDVAAEVGPLAGAELAVDADEQPRRCIEELEIALELVQSPFGVVAVDAERAVKLHAVVLAALDVGLAHVIGINRILARERARVLAIDYGGGAALELLQRLAHQRIDVPGLQVAAGGGALRPHDQVLDDFRIDWLVEKPAAGNAGSDGFKDVHRSLSFRAKSFAPFGDDPRHKA